MNDEIKPCLESKCVCGVDMDYFFKNPNFETADYVMPDIDARIDFGDAGAPIYKCTCGKLYFFSEGSLGFYQLPDKYLDEDYTVNNDEALLQRILDSTEHLKKQITNAKDERFTNYKYLKAIVLQAIEDMQQELEWKSNASLDENGEE